MLSSSEALSIARRWVNGQGHTVRAQVRPGPYSDAHQRRLVQIMYEDGGSGKTYLLAKIYVLDTGEVVVEKDRFEHVMALLVSEGIQPSRKGERVSHEVLVARFAEALTNGIAMPDWYHGYEVVRGLSHAADAKVFIRHGKARLELLVKVVTTKQDKANYFQNIPSREIAHMYAAIVTQDMSYDRIVYDLVTRVEGMFENGSMKFLRRSSDQAKT